MRRADEILDQVATFYGVEVAELRGRRRWSRLALPRHVAAYVMRQAGYTTVEIGETIGGRDPSTISYAIEHVARQAAADPRFAVEVAALVARALDRWPERGSLLDQLLAEIADLTEQNAALRRALDQASRQRRPGPIAIYRSADTA